MKSHYVNTIYMLYLYAIIAYKYKVYINISKLYKYGNIHYIKTANYINTINKAKI